jgi:hypothetical protein
MISDLDLRVRWLLVTALVVGLLAGVGTGSSVQAQEQQVRVANQAVSYSRLKPDWQDCGLREIEEDAFTSRQMVRRKQARKTATIQVDYGTGFTSEAREAFQRAVEVWEAHITSPVTIRVDASFGDLEENVLGGAGPNFLYAVDTNGDDDFDTVYGDALADALSDQDQQPGEPDIVATFNRNRDDWHFGEEEAPSGTIDFTSVVLHEIGHGLNYIDITGVGDGGAGQYGDIDFNSDGSPDGIPSVFTRLLAQENTDGSLTAITNESAFPNPSRALGDALTSNRLVFDADNANAAAAQDAGPIPPKIYAPSSYEEGSSIAHLDEQTYPFESPNALMTPRINTAETNRLPGPIVCGQLYDMGWPTGGRCVRYFQDVFALQFAEATDTTRGQVTLDWEVSENANIQEYVVEQKYFGESFEPVRRVDPAAAPPVTLDSLGLGRFAFRVRWIYDDGSEGTSIENVSTTVNLTDLTAEVAERDQVGRATVQVGWTVPPGTDGFTYRVERAEGQGEAFRRIGGGSGSTFEEDRVPPGQYRYRVVSQDGQGNEIASAKASADISFEGDVFVIGPYPQPTQGRATVLLTARETQEVAVEVFNTLGRRVYLERRTLQAQEATPLRFDTQQWSSGVYFLRVDGQQFTTKRKLVVVR